MINENSLELMENRKLMNEKIENLIKGQASENRDMHILEAGCGKHWPFQLNEIQYILTGIDMDKAALNIRMNVVSDLHEAIEGNLCTVDLSKDKFDVIYCSYVLEHVEKADMVMKNFVKWTKPNGIIIIKVPDPYSVQGYITRVTPHWFHVFYYRFLGRRKNAGKPGYAPYPTYYNPVISRSGMHSFCKEEGSNVLLEAEFGDGFIRPGHGVVKIMIHIFKRVINILSIGTLSSRHTNLLYVLRKTT